MDCKEAKERLAKYFKKIIGEIDVEKYRVEIWDWEYAIREYITIEPLIEKSEEYFVPISKIQEYLSEVNKEEGENKDKYIDIYGTWPSMQFIFPANEEDRTFKSDGNFEIHYFKNNILRIFADKYVFLEMRANEGNISRPSRYSSYASLVFYDAGCTIQCNKQKRPYWFSEEIYWDKEDNFINWVFSAIHNFLVNEVGSKLFLDYVRDYQLLKEKHPDYDFFTANVGWTDCIQYPNKQIWAESKIAKKYKGKVHCNWNKRSFPFIYAYLQMLPKLEPGDYNALAQIPAKDEYMFCGVDSTCNLSHFTCSLNSMLPEIVCAKYQTYIRYKRTDYKYRDKYTPEEQREMQLIAFDLANMKRRRREKLFLHKMSRKNIQKEHDRIIDEQFLASIELKMPKNTQFDKLYQNCPVEWEFVKDKERLIREGREMHNCVSTYASYINKDECCILSAILNNHRYTIEIRNHGTKKDPEYFIQQIQLPYNQGYNQEDREIVEKWLDTMAGKTK